MTPCLYVPESSQQHMPHRGEIVRDVAPPLGLGTPLLLVKPPVGLSTPAIFRRASVAYLTSCWTAVLQSIRRSITAGP